MKHINIFLSVAALLFISFDSLNAKNSEVPEFEVVSEMQKNGFVGECIEYNLYLKSTVPNVADVRVVDHPYIPENVDAIRGSIGGSQRPKEVTEKGKKFYSWNILKIFLIPKEEGKLNIGSGKIVVFIPKERIVNDYFWGARRIVEYDEVAINFKGKDISIKKLPANTTKFDFADCVGEFEIEGWFPPGKIIKDKEAIVVFSISGKGDLSNLRVPNLSKLFTDGCELKEVERTEHRTQRNGTLFSEVILTCKFIPNNTDFTIGSLSILEFNPDTKKYEVISSDTLHWDKTDDVKKNTSIPKGAIEI